MGNYYMDKLKRLSQRSYEKGSNTQNFASQSASGRLYTKEDIDLMPVEELKANWNNINEQNKVYGIPSVNQAKNYTQSGEVVFINDATPRYEINIDNSTNQPKLQQGAFKNGNFNNFQAEPSANNIAVPMNTPQVQGIMPYEEEDPTPYHDWGSEAGKNFPSPFGILFKPRTTQNAYADESETIPEEPSPSENGKDDILKGRVEYEERRVPPPDYRDYPDEEEDEEDKKKKPKQLNLLELLATDGISLAKAIHTGSGINQVELFNDIKNNIGSSLKDYPEAQPLYTDVSDMRQAAYRQHVFEVNNMQEEAAIEKQKLDEMAAKFYENYGNAEIPMSMEPMSTPDYYRTPPAPIKNNEAEEFYQARKEAPEPDYNYNYNPYTRYVYGYDDSLRQNYNKAFESQRPQNSGYRPPAEPVFYPQTPYDPSQEPGFDFENYAQQQPQINENTYQQMLESKYSKDWSNRASSANDAFLYNNLLSNRYSNDIENARQKEYSERFGPTDKISLMDFITELKNNVERRRQKREIIDPMLNEFVIKENVPMEHRNALRHRAGSALMSNIIGSPSKARLLGNFKEVDDLLRLKENDTPIDLRNNELGRRLYKQYPDLSNEELLKKVYKDIQENPDVPEEYKDTLFWEILWNSLGFYNDIRRKK
ncbi:MAG: hypothetical protein PHX18_07180 [Candidatus Gastranaerophilales bacterium]|nr:hypothetical protein [Candidatus Gastranaerophilales bacterium]